MIKQIASILLIGSSLVAVAQNKEVKIIKKTGNASSKVLDSNVNVSVNIDTNINTNVNFSIVVDGDNITINGKPADKNDPRLKIMKGKHSMQMRSPNQKSFEIISDSAQGQMDDLDIELDDMMTPPMPPTSNAAFLGVITEATDKGAKINTVSEGSPAEKAGLKQNDIITKVNDKKIDGPKALYEAIGTLKPEDKISIQYMHNGKELKTTAVLAKNKTIDTRQFYSFNTPNVKMPNNMGRGFNFEMPAMPELDGMMNRFNRKPKLGISIEDIESGEGVRIKNVVAESPADKAGLKTNDIITQFDEHKVTDVSDLKWEYLQEGQVLKFNILRNGEKKNIEVKIPKKLKSVDL